MRDEREVIVTIHTIKNFNVAGVVEMIRDEYVSSEEGRKNFLRDIRNGEYEGIFVDFAEAFLRNSKLHINDAKGGQRLADVNFTDFGMEELNLYISDLCDAMSCVSEKHGELISLLEKAGFDYSKDFWRLPQLVYINDISFRSDDTDDMNVAVDSIIASLCVNFCNEKNDKILAAYFVNDDTEQEILMSKNFMTVGSSDLMLKICSIKDIPLKVM